MRSLLAVAVLLQGVTVPAAAPTLEQLRADVNALNYSQAAKSIELIRATSGLSRTEALEFYLQEGLVKAALKDSGGAKEAFTRALLIDPALKLPGKVAPRVTTPFLEAKGWVKSAGGLGLVAEGARPQAGDGWTVVVKPVADEKQLLTEAVFTISEDGVTRTQTTRPSEGSRLEGRGLRVRVEWQLLGANRWVLAEGSLQLGAPAEAIAPLPSPAPVTAVPVSPGPASQAPRVEPAAVVEAAPPKAGFPKAPGVAALAVGGGAVAVGALFLVSAGTNSNLAQRATTWTELKNTSAAGRTFQTIGAAAVGVGAAVAAAGVAMLITSAVTGSARASLSVGVVPGGGVVVLSGAAP